MARRTTRDPELPRSPRHAATTPEGRENQLIAAAVDLAERQLEDGTAAAQVITHYLKLGSSREKLEQERMAMEVELMQAKKDNMMSAARTEELLTAALSAFRSYSGADPQSTEEDNDDPDAY